MPVYDPDNWKRFKYWIRRLPRPRFAWMSPRGDVVRCHPENVDVVTAFVNERGFRAVVVPQLRAVPEAIPGPGAKQ